MSTPDSWWRPASISEMIEARHLFDEEDDDG